MTENAHSSTAITYAPTVPDGASVPTPSVGEPSMGEPSVGEPSVGEPSVGEAAACLTHLVRRGLVDPEGAALTPLTGGISNDVFAVTGADGRGLVVKRALSRLRVAGLWVASPARTGTEAAALRLAGRLVPGAVPDVVDLDAGYLVITRAPRSWTTWKDDLMAGRADPAVAEALGTALATWQRRTASGADSSGLADPSGTPGQQVRARLAELTGFMEQRVRPFHRVVRNVHPDLADHVDTTLSIMLGQATCLVHGDFTPKNMLVAPPDPRVAQGLEPPAARPCDCPPPAARPCDCPPPAARGTTIAPPSAKPTIAPPSAKPTIAPPSAKPTIAPPSAKPTIAPPSASYDRSASGPLGGGTNGQRRVWVVDWEIAHLGDPTFDPGSMIAHLLVKSVHRPETMAGYRECAQAFLAALVAGTAGTVASDPAQLVRQVGCMLLARVDGTSPLPYLSEHSRTGVRALGRTLLLDPVDGVLDAWDILRRGRTSVDPG